MERFIYHHPKLYMRGLVVALALFSATGVGSVVFAADSSNESRSGVVSPTMAPPKHSEAVVKTQPAKPKGWENVDRLPGRSGSGVAQAPSTVVQPVRVVVANPAIPLGSSSAMSLGRSLNAVKFGDQHWPALQALWTRESNWNPAARNRSSGACGIPQALPCSKIPDMSPQGQIQWGLQYIQKRYGNPTNAWHFWLQNHWY